MIILISGIPGTGKSFLGDYLAEHHEFTHVDLEVQAGLQYLTLLQQKDFDGFVEQVSNLGDRIALTFGYPPEWLPVIEQLAVRGVVTAWLDSPLIFSRKHWKPEPGQDPGTYTIQIAKIIDAHEKLDAFYGARKICVADSNCDDFRPVEDIATRLLGMKAAKVQE